MIVFATILDLFMGFGKLPFRLVVVGGSLDFPGKFAVGLRDVMPRLLEKERVVDVSPG